MPSQKPPVSAWIVSERKRKGWKVIDLSNALKAAGYDAEPSTVGVWEAGRKPRGETIEGLERIFGSSAPRDVPEAGNMSDLVGALRAQTDALMRLADAVTQALSRIDRAALDAHQERQELAEMLGVAARAATLAETPAAAERTRRARNQ